MQSSPVPRRGPSALAPARRPPRRSGRVATCLGAFGGYRLGMPKDSAWLDVLEYAAERTRRELGVATLSISSFETRARRPADAGQHGRARAGRGSAPRPGAVPAGPLPARRSGSAAAATPYLSTPDAPGDAAAIALECALGKSSQAGGADHHPRRVWGELWTASTLADLPLTEADLPGICSAAERLRRRPGARAGRPAAPPGAAAGRPHCAPAARPAAPDAPAASARVSGRARGGGARRRGPCRARAASG